MSVNKVTVIIELLGGNEDGKIFEFSEFPVTIGRHYEDDLYISEDLCISRHHARIIYEDEGLFLEDVGREGQGSTNGTYLNDVRITSKTMLSNGDILYIGNTGFRFRTHE